MIYDTDGIVIRSNDIPFEHRDKPLYSVAFKF